MMASEMQTRLVLREATAGDATAVVDVLLAANAEYAQTMSPAAWDAYVTNIVELVRVRDDRSLLLVAETAGEVIGAVTFLPDASHEGFGLPTDWAGFRALAVHPRARGAGIGRALVEHCADRARELGAGAVGIHTASFMETAGPFYEALGFVRCPEYDSGAAVVLGARAHTIAAIAYRLEL
jgi:GNAT superfamily N-acetyltransferase